MKRLQTIWIAAALVTLVAPAQARTACYTPPQQQAEQLLRLHSELMVITVTCKTNSDGNDLGAVYGDFTKKNINALHGAEQTMLAYYKANIPGNATEHLDRLRTVLGNEFGQKAADMSAPEFCAAYRDKPVKFDTLSSADVENEAQRMTIAERSYAKPCAVPLATAPTKAN